MPIRPIRGTAIEHAHNLHKTALNPGTEALKPQGRSIRALLGGFWNVPVTLQIGQAQHQRAEFGTLHLQIKAEISKATIGGQRGHHTSNRARSRIRCCQ